MSDQSQRTEQPTPKRLQKARQEGQFPISRELVIGIQSLATVWLLSTYGSALIQAGKALVRGSIRAAFEAPFTTERLLLGARTLTAETLRLGLFAAFAITLLPLLIHLASTQLGISTKRLRPDLSRLNPIQRLQGLAAQNAAAAVIASISLIGAIGLLYMLVRSRFTLLALSLGSLSSGLYSGAAEVRSLLWKGAGGLFVIGLVDYFYQRHRWQQSLRMTKQEIRDEHKEAEGNPEMKMRLRRIRRDLLRRQMMREVPKATAVITNPTHYAVAIRYELNSMAAPTVIAKGKNYLALRIREKAKDHEIPIVENPPLAQALYKSVDVGQEIPPHLYRAVAEILAYIFRLMNNRRPG